MDGFGLDVVSVANRLLQSDSWTLAKEAWAADLGCGEIDEGSTSQFARTRHIILHTRFFFRDLCLVFCVFPRDVVGVSHKDLGQLHCGRGHDRGLCHSALLLVQ